MMLCANHRWSRIAASEVICAFFAIVYGRPIENSLGQKSVFFIKLYLPIRNYSFAIVKYIFRVKCLYKTDINGNTWRVDLLK